MSEQPGILRCSICGYVGAFYIPCVCSRCMEKHHAVVDAAMAWYEHFQTPNVQLFDRLTERLRDACRRAEEVERA